MLRAIRNRAEILYGRSVLILTDSTSLFGALVSGGSMKSTRLNTIVGLIHPELAKFNINAYCDYVQGKLNLADLPTRPGDNVFKEWRMKSFAREVVVIPIDHDLVAEEFYNNHRGNLPVIES